MEVLSSIADDAEHESPLWARLLRAHDQRELDPVFSDLAPTRFAVGVETIYEAYLVHYGRPRLFADLDADEAVLLGDYLYAHGLVRIAAARKVDAVADLSELISLCSQLRAEERSGDGPLWAATAALLGRRALDEPFAALRLHSDPAPLDAAARTAAGDEAVDVALAAHAERRVR